MSGYYEFTAAVLNAGGKHTGLEVVKNGQWVTKIQSGDSNYYTMGTNAVVLQLVIGKKNALLEIVRKYQLATYIFF